MPSSSLVSLLKPVFTSTQAILHTNPDFQASSRNVSLTFGIQSSDEDEVVVITLSPDRGNVSFTTGSSASTSFTLSARPSDWTAFFSSPPPRSFQSYWGILRVHGHNEGVSVLGNQSLFGRHARIWRIILDTFRTALHPPASSSIPNASQPSSSSTIPPSELHEPDHLTGRYLWITTPLSGRSKIFYETSGSGSQDLLLLHTAGADSRQCHSVMNHPRMLERCRMVAFDLPNHGRSYPSENLSPEGWALDEEEYLACIAAVIQRLGLKDVIVSGASMGGQVCLAVAMRAAELGVKGVVPLEGCEHLPFTQPIYEVSGDESILNPERVCGMISPTAPEWYRKLIWWGYSSQGTRIFPGDLKFYFQGWDGRGRVEEIDTRVCPVNMLTGEYDYSCTAEMSEETARKIPGARFERMEGLGHFPMTENPERFVPYLEKAIDFIQATRS